MKLGCIDVGMNTVLLLIGESSNSEIEVIREEIRIPRIGKSIMKNNIIDQNSINELVEILWEYKQLCHSIKVDKIICNGTAPFRLAKNSEEVISTVFQSTGIKIKILSNIEEAVLSFIGGVSNFDSYFDRKDFVVIDIGGGSTEIIYGNMNEIKYFRSFPVGAVILKELFFNEKASEDLKREDDYLSVIFQEKLYFNNFIGIAVAGTPTTIASILLNQVIFNEKEVDKFKIKKRDLEHLINEFARSSPQQILKKYPSVLRGREDVILPGSIILDFIMKLLGIEEIFVSTRGVRYGIFIQELMNQETGFWTKVGLRKFLSSLNG